MIEDGDSKEITREHVLPLLCGASVPRVCIFAAFNAHYAPLADIARPNWTAYARRHGYAVRFYPRGYHLDPAHPRSYGDKNRFAWYYDVRGFCELVVYLDIDSLFMNHDVSLTDTRGFAPFVYTYDAGGPQSGLWIARTDAETQSHLRYAYEYAATENNVRHGKIEPHGISDQDAFTRLMRVPPFSRTFGNCFPAKEIGYVHANDYEAGDWIVHFGGMPFAEKLQRMKEFAARV